MEDINAEHESKFRPNWLKVDIPNMSLSGWYAWGRDPGIYMENSGWILSTIQMINQIRIMDHLSNISSIAWIKYAIADSSIMECWREMSACFPSLDTGFRGSHRWGVSAAAWKGSWVGWYNHQGETQKDSWYIIQLWGIKNFIRNDCFGEIWGEHLGTRVNLTTSYLLCYGFNMLLHIQCY